MGFARRFLVGALVVTAVVSARPVRAQEPARQGRSGVVTAPAQVTIEAPDAERTRELLRELLGKYPPSLSRVLKLDPSLLSNEQYLGPYPALATFLNQHPEVRRAPGYFLEWVSVQGDGGYRP